MVSMYFMQTSFDWGMGPGLLALPVWAPPLFLLLILWTLVWKGLALWRSAKRGDKWWFVAFLLVNTLGILEILYLFVVTGAKISDFTGGFKNTQA